MTRIRALPMAALAALGLMAFSAPSQALQASGVPSAQRQDTASDLLVPVQYHRGEREWRERQERRAIRHEMRREHRERQIRREMRREWRARHGHGYYR